MDNGEESTNIANNPRADGMADENVEPDHVQCCSTSSNTNDIII